MSDFAYWNPATDPDKFRALKELEWAGQVQFCLLEPGQEIGYVRVLGSWFGRYFR
jgi:hypothetical protein